MQLCGKACGGCLLPATQVMDDKADNFGRLASKE